MTTETTPSHARPSVGLTLLLMASQYFVGLDLARRGTEYAPINSSPD